MAEKTLQVGDRVVFNLYGQSAMKGGTVVEVSPSGQRTNIDDQWYKTEEIVVQEAWTPKVTKAEGCGPSIDPDAVAEALLNGLSVREVSNRFKVSQKAITHVQDRLKAEGKLDQNGKVVPPPAPVELVTKTQSTPGADAGKVAASTDTDTVTQ